MAASEAVVEGASHDDSFPTRARVADGRIYPETFIRSPKYSDYRWRKAIDVPVYAQLLKEFGYE